MQQQQSYFDIASPVPYSPEYYIAFLRNYENMVDIPASYLKDMVYLTIELGNLIVNAIVYRDTPLQAIGGLLRFVWSAVIPSPTEEQIDAISLDPLTVMIATFDICFNRRDTILLDSLDPNVFTLTIGEIMRLGDGLLTYEPVSLNGRSIKAIKLRVVDVYDVGLNAEPLILRPAATNMGFFVIDIMPGMGGYTIFPLRRYTQMVTNEIPQYSLEKEEINPQAREKYCKRRQTMQQRQIAPFSLPTPTNEEKRSFQRSVTWSDTPPEIINSQQTEPSKLFSEPSRMSGNGKQNMGSQDLFTENINTGTLQRDISGQQFQFNDPTPFTFASNGRGTASTRQSSSMGNTQPTVRVETDSFESFSERIPSWIQSGSDTRSTFVLSEDSEIFPFTPPQTVQRLEQRRATMPLPGRFGARLQNASF